MGTFVKYLIYIALVVAVFFIAKGLWEENSDNTVEEIVVGVSDNAPTSPNSPTADTTPAQK